jgi:hypothetical protein
MTITKFSHLAITACLLALILAPSASGQDGEEHSTYLPLALQSHDPGLAWLEPGQVELEPFPRSSPLSVIDKQGRLHLFWDTLDGPGFIYHVMQTSNGWTETAPVAPSIGISSTVSDPYVDEEGTLHLLWKNHLGYGIDKPYRLLYASFDGGRWSPEVEIARLGDEPSGMIHTREGGELQVTYSFGSLPTRFYYTIHTASGWSSAVELAPLRDSFLIFLGYYRVWGDNQGGIHVYEIPYFSKSALYFYWRNGFWQVKERILEGRISESALMFDNLNNLHLYWSGTVPVPGGQVSGLYHQCVEDNRVFGPQEVPSGGEAVSGSVARASDQRSQIGLAWKEAGGKFKLGTWQGCSYLGQRVVPFPADLNLELSSLAMSADPGKLCAVARVLYGNEHVVVCGEVRR